MNKKYIICYYSHSKKCINLYIYNYDITQFVPPMDSQRGHSQKPFIGTKILKETKKKTKTEIYREKGGGTHTTHN